MGEQVANERRRDRRSEDTGHDGRKAAALNRASSARAWRDLHGGDPPGRGLRGFEILESRAASAARGTTTATPGCACDIPSRLYSFSFELKARLDAPASQPEILAYLEHCAAKYGILPHCRFGDAMQRA